MGASEVKRLRAEYKVLGGKLVAAETRVVGGYLVDVKISGDFFMHPEEAIIDLEKKLTGIKLDELEPTIFKFFADRKITLFGIAPEDFIHVIRLSLSFT